MINVLGEGKEGVVVLCLAKSRRWGVEEGGQGQPALQQLLSLQPKPDPVRLRGAPSGVSRAPFSPSQGKRRRGGGTDTGGGARPRASGPHRARRRPGGSGRAALTGSGVSTTSLTAPPKQGRQSPMAGPTAGTAGGGRGGRGGGGEGGKGGGGPACGLRPAPRSGRARPASGPCGAAGGGHGRGQGRARAERCEPRRCLRLCGVTGGGAEGGGEVTARGITPGTVPV